MSSTDTDRLKALFGLEGRVALVTGASSGLGAHFAETLAAAGAEVVLAARRTDRLEDLAARLTKAGRTARTVAMDVTDAGSVTAALETVGPALDILINNSGVSGTESAEATSEETWDRVIDTNLKGPWLVTRAALPALRARQGAVINIASILGFGVLKNVSSYAASKAGVIQLTKAMALELAPDGIRVNAIAPGYFQTEINAGFFETEAGRRRLKGVPFRRLGRPEELDAALLTLAGPGGAFMTGTTLTVDGGNAIGLT